jgi:hypothetical protein
MKKIKRIRPLKIAGIAVLSILVFLFVLMVVIGLYRPPTFVPKNVTNITLPSLPMVQDLVNTNYSYGEKEAVSTKMKSRPIAVMPAGKKYIIFDRQNESDISLEYVSSFDTQKYQHLVLDSSNCNKPLDECYREQILNMTGEQATLTYENTSITDVYISIGGIGCVVTEIWVVADKNGTPLTVAESEFCSS